jgi:hypothetical protein
LISLTIRAMTKNDTKCYDKVTTIQPQDHICCDYWKAM